MNKFILLLLFLSLTYCSSRGQNAEYYFKLGNAEIEKNNYTQAIEYFTKSISLDYTHASVFFNRGLCYKEISKFDDAISDFTKAIILDPKYTKAYDKRGDIYEIKSDCVNAIKDWKQAIKLDSSLEPKLKNKIDNCGSDDDFWFF